MYWTKREKCFKQISIPLFKNIIHITELLDLCFNLTFPLHFKKNNLVGWYTWPTWKMTARKSESESCSTGAGIFLLACKIQMICFHMTYLFIMSPKLVLNHERRFLPPTFNPVEWFSSQHMEGYKNSDTTLLFCLAIYGCRMHLSHWSLSPSIVHIRSNLNFNLLQW